MPDGDPIAAALADAFHRAIGAHAERFQGWSPDYEDTDLFLQTAAGMRIL